MLELNSFMHKYLILYDDQTMMMTEEISWNLVMIDFFNVDIFLNSYTARLSQFTKT